jgi:hypothetical protein
VVELLAALLGSRQAASSKALGESSGCEEMEEDEEAGGRAGAATTSASSAGTGERGQEEHGLEGGTPVLEGGMVGTVMDCVQACTGAWSCVCSSF